MIGRFACLSVSDNVTINSYYNGTKYSYIMYKNGTGISIDKVGESQPEDCQQGVEVVATNLSLSTGEFAQAIKKLCFFENLTIIGTNLSNNFNDVVDRFNKRIIHHYNNFSTCNILSGGDLRVKVGNVLYDVDNSNLFETSSDSDAAMLREFRNSVRWQDHGIVAHCEIGSVVVTPNREALQYVDKTKERVMRAWIDAVTEVYEISRASMKTDFNSIKEMYNSIIRQHSITPLPDCDFNTPIAYLYDDDAFSIQGKPMAKFMLIALRNLDWQKIDANFVDKIVSADGRAGKPKTFDAKLLVLYNICIKKVPKLNAITYSWYAEQYGGLIIVKKEFWRHFWQSAYKDTRRSNCTRVEWLRTAAYLKQFFNIIEINNDAVPKEYKESHKQEWIARTTSPSNDIRMYTQYGYRQITWDVFRRNYVSNPKSTKVIVYGDTTRASHEMLKEAAGTFTRGVIFIGMPKAMVNLCHTRRFISIEDFLMKKQNFISKAVTLKLLYTTYGKYLHYASELDFVNEVSSMTNYAFKIENTDLGRSIIEQYSNNKWLHHGLISKYRVDNIPALNEKLSIKHRLLEIPDLEGALVNFLYPKQSNDLRDRAYKRDKRMLLNLIKRIYERIQKC